MKIFALVFFLISSHVSSLISQDGFGRLATGGAGGTAVTVTDAANFALYATSNGPYIITISGTINLTSNLKITSHKTIQGADTNATVNGGIYIQYGVENIIIRNLILKNTPKVGEGDGLTIMGGRGIFVTKCTFIDCADGMCDITNRADNVTVSWCRFRYVTQTSHRYVNLIGSSDTAPDSGYLHVTIHHCWYDQLCNERMPSVRFGRVHVYNNYYSSNNALYCVRTRLYAECLVENNYYERVRNPWELALSIAPGTVTGKLSALNNNVSYLDTTNGITWLDEWYNDGIIVSKLIPGTDSVFTPPYPYILDNALDIKNIVRANAGNQVQSYLITATVSGNGSITPAGETFVPEGANQSYSIAPSPGSHIVDVLVDGSSIGANTSYTFLNVTGNHTLSATFAITTYTITATAGAHGSITPAGTTSVSSGATQSYTIIPDAGYSILNVKVDNISLGAMAAYNFTNVTTNHTIHVDFASGTVFVPPPFSAGWNLVSVPCIPSNDTAAVVFPGSFGDLFGYDAASVRYVPAPTLTVGPGYWVYFPTSTIIIFSGAIVPGPIAITCQAGWNLIGSRELSVNKSALTTNPAGQIFGDMFAYSGGSYVPTTSLVPGGGVWIYVLTACTLTIP